MKNLNAMNDKIFKNIIQTKAGMDVLIEIIQNAIGMKIDEYELLNPELKVGNRFVRGKTVDMSLKCNNTRIFVEVNNINDEKTRIRNMSYLCTKYGNDVKKGESYTRASKFYQINLSLHSLSSNIEDIYSIWNSTHDVQYVDNFTIIEYDMEKIFDLCYNQGENNIKFRFLSLLISNVDEISKISKGEEKMEEFKKELNKLVINDETEGWISYEEDLAKMERSRFLDQLAEKDNDISEKKSEIKKLLKILSKTYSKEEISNMTGISLEDIDSYL